MKRLQTTCVVFTMLLLVLFSGTIALAQGESGVQETQPGIKKEAGAEQPSPEEIAERIRQKELLKGLENRIPEDLGKIKERAGEGDDEPGNKGPGETELEGDAGGGGRDGGGGQDKPGGEDGPGDENGGDGGDGGGQGGQGQGRGDWRDLLNRSVLGLKRRVHRALEGELTEDIKGQMHSRLETAIEALGEAIDGELWEGQDPKDLRSAKRINDKEIEAAAQLLVLSRRYRRMAEAIEGKPEEEDDYNFYSKQSKTFDDLANQLANADLKLAQDALEEVRKTTEEACSERLAEVRRRYPTMSDDAAEAMRDSPTRVENLLREALGLPPTEVNAAEPWVGSDARDSVDTTINNVLPKSLRRKLATYHALRDKIAQGGNEINGPDRDGWLTGMRRVCNAMCAAMRLAMAPDLSDTGTFLCSWGYRDYCRVLSGEDYISLNGEDMMIRGLPEASAGVLTLLPVSFMIPLTTAAVGGGMSLEAARATGLPLLGTAGAGAEYTVVVIGIKVTEQTLAEAGPSKSTPTTTLRLNPAPEPALPFDEDEAMMRGPDTLDEEVRGPEPVDEVLRGPDALDEDMRGLEPLDQDLRDLDPLRNPLTDFGPIQADVGPDGIAILVGVASVEQAEKLRRLIAIDQDLRTELPDAGADPAELALPGPQSSILVYAEPGVSLDPDLAPYLTDTVVVPGAAPVYVLTCPEGEAAALQQTAEAADGVTLVQENACGGKRPGRTDPHFNSGGSWGQNHDDQWAIKRIGFDDGRKSAWKKLGKRPQPVVVAVVDTGLDWNHTDMPWSAIWRNEGEIPGNGVDDDRNGYVDDVIGWDFVRDSDRPWDHDGHGTFVAGIIAAAGDNDRGICGINPHARIMVLRALNAFGDTRASYLAEAIVYAADNGARVVNVSAACTPPTRVLAMALAYAELKGVLVVAAAGNEAEDVRKHDPAGVESVLTVATTGLTDEREGFSNWGAAVDIAAPGMDVMSLRAWRTDLMQGIPGVNYKAGSCFVGEDRCYYRASGTSFSAPLVTGVASLLFSKDPSLSADQVRRMILQSARDIDVPGLDQHTGYGLLDARGALDADPAFYVTAWIAGVAAAQSEGQTVVRVTGSCDADRFRRASLELGEGKAPSEWKQVAKIKQPVTDGVLAEIPAGELSGASTWTLRLVTEHKKRRRRESRYELVLR